MDTLNTPCRRNRRTHFVYYMSHVRLFYQSYNQANNESKLSKSSKYNRHKGQLLADSTRFTDFNSFVSIILCRA